MTQMKLTRKQKRAYRKAKRRGPRKEPMTFKEYIEALDRAGPTYPVKPIILTYFGDAAQPRKSFIRSLFASAWTLAK